MAVRPWRELVDDVDRQRADYPPGEAPAFLLTARRIFARRAEREEGPQRPAQLDLTRPPSEAA